MLGYLECMLADLEPLSSIFFLFLSLAKTKFPRH